jgi:hypothetical protein
MASMAKILRTDRYWRDRPLHQFLEGSSFGEHECYHEGPWLKTIGQALHDAVNVRVQNVADYYWESPKENWSIHQDFPCISPPWELSWMEFMQPPMPADEDHFAIPARPSGTLIMASQEVHQDLPAWYNRQEDESYCRWHLILINFFLVRDHIYGADTLIRVSNTGRGFGNNIATNGSHEFSVHPFSRKGAPIFQDWKLANLALIELNVPLLALSLANCVNTKVINDPTNFVAKKPKVLQEYVKKHGQPPTKWHLLEIGGTVRLINQAKRDAHEEGASTQRALHLARGHFKTYGREGRKKLFGTLAGHWFWRPQMRGDSNKGRVITDYSVKK